MGATNDARAAAGWSHFPHAADAGIEAVGPTLDAVFEQAGLALTALVTDAPVQSRFKVSVRCSANDIEMLLVDWLNALIYEMATRSAVFGEYHVHVEGTTLVAEAGGEPVDQRRHAPAVEPKGATFTALCVAPRAEGGWKARCVVDV